MPVIKLYTRINAPIEVCFDLARSIDLHTDSMQHTGETAIAGKMHGLIEPGETVTWRAKHFGIWQSLTSKITEFDRPNYFVDEMVKGAFKRFRHEHRFEQSGGATIMTDIFDFDAPFGFLGKIAVVLFLRKYMIQLLERRNVEIKQAAENQYKALSV